MYGAYGDPYATRTAEPRAARPVSRQPAVSLSAWDGTRDCAEDVSVRTHIIESHKLTTYTRTLLSQCRLGQAAKDKCMHTHSHVMYGVLYMHTSQLHNRQGAQPLPLAAQSSDVTGHL